MRLLVLLLLVLPLASAASFESSVTLDPMQVDLDPADQTVEGKMVDGKWVPGEHVQMVTARLVATLECDVPITGDVPPLFIHTGTGATAQYYGFQDPETGEIDAQSYYTYKVYTDDLNVTHDWVQEGIGNRFTIDATITFRVASNHEADARTTGGMDHLEVEVPFFGYFGDVIEDEQARQLDACGSGQPIPADAPETNLTVTVPREFQFPDQNDPMGERRTPAPFGLILIGLAALASRRH